MHNVCVFCGHKHLKPSQAQYIYRHDDKFLIVNDVPCLRCAYCGEEYFAGHVLRSIEKKFNEIHYHGTKASKEVCMPVEHFLNLQEA